MPCYHPLKAYISRDKHPSGKHKIVFSPVGEIMSNIELPCGQCIGCRLERSRQWAMRCMHEASMHQDNCFITLTYDDKNLPSGGTLVKQHFQKFIKRFRERIKPVRIRYYMAGEYGEKSDRAHYHAIIFNYDFKDKILLTKRGKNKLYISEALQQIWTAGMSSVGSVTFESAAYVARYCTKKINGRDAEEHYKSMDIHTGEIFTIIPEYNEMSRRPGIGKKWYEKYKKEIYPFDECIVNGHPVQPPKYYDSQLNNSDIKRIKLLRKRKAARYDKDQTYERLEDREKVCKAKHKQINRSL